LHINSRFSGVCVAQSLTFYVVLCGPLFVFSGVCVAQSLTFYVVLCGPLFVLVGFGSRKLKKDRSYIDKMKRDKRKTNGLHNTTQKVKD
jgi:hypothetical protein